MATGDVQGSTLLPGRYGLAAYFDGFSHLEVAFMQNRFHGADRRQLAVSLWFKYLPRFRYIGYQGLINNGDCVAPPTFDIHLVVGTRNVTLAAGFNDKLDAFNNIRVQTMQNIVIKEMNNLINY